MPRCANTEALNAYHRKQDENERKFDARDDIDKPVTGFFNLPDGDCLDYEGKMSFTNGIVTFTFDDPQIAEKFGEYTDKITQILQDRVDNWDNWDDQSDRHGYDIRWNGGEFTEIEVDCE